MILHMKTALHIAVEAKRANVVRLLVDYWPEGTMEKNEDNDTALHLAARSQQTDIVKLLAPILPEVVKEKNNKLDTALYAAAGKGEAEMMVVLVELWPGGKKERNNVGEIPLAMFVKRLKRLEEWAPSILKMIWHPLQG
jgi:ankyrin repeat protein